LAAGTPAPGEIRAAGAVVWRPAGGGTQVALVHRPKYDDWSLAKGKLEPGEHVLLAAVREVREETGLAIRLGVRLPPVSYFIDGQPKRVDYWAAQVAGPAGQFEPNHEVDRLDWTALSRAAGRLSYDHDAALVAEFGAVPRPTVPLILVRHASAGRKADWRRDDSLRPLDGRGRQQADALGQLLNCFGAGRVLSSPAERCLATVRPYAEIAGVQVETEQSFGLPSGAGAKKAAPASTVPASTGAVEALAAAAREAVGRALADERPVVICAHRENMPTLLSAACAQLGAGPPDEPPLRKGEFLVLHRTAGGLAGAERHRPGSPLADEDDEDDED
jgi:8-oxo-(d)GTP phosphatase